MGVRLNLNLALGMAVFIPMDSWGVSVPGEAGSSFSSQQSPDLCCSFCPQLHPSVSGLVWPACDPGTLADPRGIPPSLWSWHPIMAFR